MADHPWSAFHGPNSVLKSLVRPINSSGEILCIDFGVLAWNCLLTPLFGSFWGIFSTYDVTHCRDPKGPSLGENTSFELFSVTVRRFDLRACARKKYRTTKKSQKCYISPIWEEDPVEPIRPKSCVAGDVHDVITCAKFQIEIFMGYDFTGGVEFSIFLLIFAWALQQCSANFCLWYSVDEIGWGRNARRPLLAVPNVTAHPSATSVPTSCYLM